MKISSSPFVAPPIFAAPFAPQRCKAGTVDTFERPRAPERAPFASEALSAIAQRALGRYLAVLPSIELPSGAGAEITGLALRDDRVHLFLSGGSGPDTLVIAEPDEGGALKAYVFAGDQLAIDTFDTTFDRWTRSIPDEAALASGRIRFRVRSEDRWTDRGWSRVFDRPPEKIDEERSLLGKVIDGAAAIGGVALAPVQTALYGIEGSVFTALGAADTALGDPDRGALSRVEGLYTFEQARLNGGLDADEAHALYLDARAMLDPAQRRAFDEVLDGVVLRARREYWGEELWKFHAGDRIGEVDRAHAASVHFGLANVPLRLFAEGRASAEEGDLYTAAKRYAQGALVIGGEAYATMGGFGAMSAPLRGAKLAAAEKIVFGIPLVAGVAEGSANLAASAVRGDGEGTADAAEHLLATGAGFAGAKLSSPRTARAARASEAPLRPKNAEAWKNYRVPDLDTHGAKYGEPAHRATMEATRAMREGRITKLSELLSFLATERQKIAFLLGEKGKERFGVPRRGRDQIAGTPRNSERYRAYGRLVPEGQPPSSIALRLELGEGGGPIGRSIRDAIRAPRDPKARIEVPRDVHQNEEHSWSVFKWRRWSGVIAGYIRGERVELTGWNKEEWLHTRPELIPRILAHAESIFQRAKDPQRSPAETTRAIAELHWWLAHAMPYERGSAGVSDMLAKSLFELRGMEVAPWRRGGSPDLRAMLNSLPAYVDLYPKLFEQPPRAKADH